MAKPAQNSGKTLIPPSKYAGERLGLPESGHQSVARFGRRLVALLIDGASANLVMLLITGSTYLTLMSRTLDAQDAYQLAKTDQNLGNVQSAATALSQYQFGVFVSFIALQILGIWAIGGSLGHRVCGLYLVNVRGGKLNAWRPVVRSVLLGLVIPALVWDSDQRGFHDKIAGTILLRSK